MSLRFCLFMLVLLLAGCDRRSTSVPLVSAEDGSPVMTEQQYGRSNPLIIDTFLPAPCRPVQSKRVAPSDYERTEFDRRLQEAKELSPRAVGVESAIDIGCIARRYSAADLSTWAVRGDPVAIYGDLSNKYRRLGDVCRNDAIIAAVLEKAYNTQFVTVDGVRISRLPELYYLVGRVKLACGRKGATEYLSATYDRGYFPPGPIM